jgi:hypothetical protein
MILRLGFLVLVLAGCGLGPDASGPCAPVDVGGECFEPSEEQFIEHALASAGAWPQLDGVEVPADVVIEGTDLSSNRPTWVVPLLADGEIVAISRLVPVSGNLVKLGEVALLEEALAPLPVDLGGEFVLYADGARCIDDPDPSCLFSEYPWAVRLEDGRFRLPNGELVDQVG